MSKLNYGEIEKKWQKYWQENNINKTDNDFGDSKKKFYILDMFPYPSGEGLHVGHPKGYIATDVYSRLKKMQGYNVLHPMGWDAFGLPAEQYAIKNKINPNIATEKNVKRYKEQIEMLGLNYDWDREINTTDPKFYKWTQWMFKQMYKDGLAHESFEPINWCPSCKTGLANEDLDGNVCERCGSIVEKKPLRQWVIKITNYADRLLEDLDKLNWEPHIKELQRNWIGKSEGSEIDFEIKIGNKEPVESFKFRPELVSLIKEGKKNITFRMVEKKNIQIGDIVNLIDWADDNIENQKIFGKAKILEISESKLGDLPLDYPGHEKDDSVESRLERYKKYYGDFITNDSIVYVYKFQPLSLKIFTTRADTLYGCTFMAISYSLAKEWIESGWQANEEIKNFIAKLEKEEKERTVDFDMSKLEKEGIDTGIKAINPANGEDVPIYIANYILSDYGTGAIMAVPAHDERDYEFAKKYGIEIREVIKDKNSDSQESLFEGEGLLVNSQEFDGMNSEEARIKITEKVGGKIVSKYKLKDWVFARQRYWGEPFPIVFDIDENGNRKSYAVADKELPVILPNVENYEPSGTGESPLANIKNWVEVYGFINKDGEFEGIDLEKEIITVGEVLSDAKEVFGSTVIAYDPNKKLFLKMENKNKENKPWLPCGGVDDNESYEDCALRELKEEAGISKIDKIIKLGSPIISYYFNPNKNSNRKSVGYNYLVFVNSNQEIEQAQESHENFEIKWVSYEELLKSIQDAKIGKHWEVALERAKYIIDLNKEIKKFYRETNTMPQWAGSSWYYLRYIDPKNDNEFVNKDLEKNWSPVDFYVGGAEHATRHLIYARFWHKFLFDKGFVNYDEPFNKLQTVGLIMAEDGKKMSKRYNNVVNPDDVVKEYGADAMRAYEMFMGPFEKAINWSTNSMSGVSRFLERVYNLAEKVSIKPGTDSREVERIINESIKKVGEDILAFKFNTAISQLMICLNTFERELQKGNNISKDTLEKFVQILAPFSVHISEEIWQNLLGNNFSIHTSNWPNFDEEKIKKDEIEMSLQISGKFRGTFTIKPDSSNEEVEAFVKTTDIYKKYIVDNLEPKKIIIVKNRLINIVI